MHGTLKGHIKKEKGHLIAVLETNYRLWRIDAYYKESYFFKPFGRQRQSENYNRKSKANIPNVSPPYLGEKVSDQTTV